MKTIIVPIDFSDSSLNALSFAAELSKRSSASLMIVNMLQESETEEKVKTKLKVIERDLKKRFGSDLNCESSIAHGNLVAGVLDVTDRRCVSSNSLAGDRTGCYRGQHGNRALQRGSQLHWNGSSWYGLRTRACPHVGPLQTRCGSNPTAKPPDCTIIAQD